MIGFKIEKIEQLVFKFWDLEKRKKERIDDKEQLDGVKRSL